jgi:cell division protein FtsW (lipid II flippase)
LGSKDKKLGNNTKNNFAQGIKESWKDEKRLLMFTYFLCTVCFLNLYLIRTPFDKGALVMAGILCIMIFYANFVVRKFFPDGDKYLLVFASILSLIGIVMLYRLNVSVAIKQVLWFTSGIAAYILIVVLIPDLKKFSRFKYAFLILTLVFMSLGTFFAQEEYGSRNWIKLGFMSFQPSEFGKLFLVAYLAASLKDYRISKDLIQPAAVVMLSLGFMVMQKDLGSALIFFSISVTMLFIATSKFKYVLVCILLFIAGAYISYKLFGHVRLRYMIWKNPWPYASNESYQIVQSMFSIASGGLFGSGLGLGHPEFVPVATTDFIFSAICEEFGVLMGLGIIILFFLLFYRCMRAAIYVEDKFLQLITVGYSAMIASQVLVIIGGVVNMIPLTGITLPFVSYGGSSIIISFISLAIIQKISEEE